MRWETLELFRALEIRTGARQSYVLSLTIFNIAIILDIRHRLKPDHRITVLEYAIMLILFADSCDEMQMILNKKCQRLQRELDLGSM